MPLVSHPLDKIKHLIQQGEFKLALALCDKFCQQHPNNLQAWFILSDLYIRNKQTAAALAAVLKAEAIDNLQPQVQIVKVHCLLLTGDSALALATAKKLYLQQPTLLAKDWSSLGAHFHRLNALSLAHQCFINAVECEPDHSQYRFNLATSLRNCGELAQSALEFNRVIALTPNDWDAHLARTLLTKVTREHNNIVSLRSLIDNHKNERNAQIKLHFALAKEQEDCGDYPASFKNLHYANTLRNQFTRYDVLHDIEAMAAIRSTFSSKNKTINGTVNVSNQPIFIVGLPRTGTTLLERIIGQHPAVFCAGELHNFSACLTKAVLSKTATNNAVKTSNPKLDFIIQSATIDFTQLGAAYIESTRVLCGHKRHFIDKMPLNFLYTGLIQQALPQAKIIHLTRSPMATCYAIYKTNFAQAYPFAYDLNNLAQYYLAYRGLMQHWQQLNPQNILEVNYEQLVSSPDLVSQQVFDFLGLEWQKTYLNLAGNKSASATASAAQIRGEIYQSSLNLWRNYQLELQTLRQCLEHSEIDPEQW